MNSSGRVPEDQVINVRLAGIVTGQVVMSNRHRSGRLVGSSQVRSAGRSSQVWSGYRGSVSVKL